MFMIALNSSLFLNADAFEIKPQKGTDSLPPKLVDIVSQVIDLQTVTLTDCYCMMAALLDPATSEEGMYWIERLLWSIRRRQVQLAEAFSKGRNGETIVIDEKSPKVENEETIVMDKELIEVETTVVEEDITEITRETFILMKPWDTIC